MRLKHIKLAGFKSFVDPTEVALPGRVSGVVGPNGCGKSNIIDAVRWVMGESSAKYLRGESIADVIFNGAAGRNPVGQASVELVFDNNEGRLGGEYGRYAEIAIRRVVTREGQSSYFLNNTRCRRRDIMDIFRGTGLGPRSYAIIEQGMISRLIEAKPEELRTYLEEAAGITKYKDRRRETELRIEHTRINLTRLHDLREELATQLERLQRQAKAAEKYKEYKIEEYQYNTQLHALRWQGLNSQITVQQQQVNDLALTYEKLAAEHTHTLTQIEEVRLTYSEFNEHVQQRQAEYYTASAEVTRIEQEISHLKQRRQTLQADLLDAEQRFQTAQALTITDEENIKRHMQALEELTPQQAEQEELLAEAQLNLEKAEQEMAQSQRQWEELQQQLAHQQKNTELLRVQIQHAEEQLSNYHQRSKKLQEEQQQLIIHDLLSERDLLAEQLQEELLIQQELNTEIETKSELLAQQQTNNNNNRQALHHARVDLQKLQGQHASLIELQNAALGQDNQALTEWLTQQELTDYPRLAEGLRVTAGWELAAEFVLKEFLPALVVQQAVMLQLATLAQTAASQLPGRLSLYLPINSQESHTTQHAEWQTLRQHIQSDFPLSGLVAGIYCAPDLASALAWRENLQAHESLITPQGIWLGKDWLRVYQADATQSGIIARQQLLTSLEEQIANQTERVEKLAEELHAGEQQVQRLDQERESLRATYQQKHREYAQHQARMQEISAKIQHQQQREQTITQEITELQHAIETAQERLHQANSDLASSRDQLEQVVAQQQSYAHQREVAQEHVRQARHTVDAQRNNLHSLSVRLNTLQSELNAARSSLTRMQQQVRDLAGRQEQLHSQLETINEPLVQIEQQLTVALTARVETEQNLAVARDKLAEIEKQLRDLEHQQLTQTQAMENARNAVENARLTLTSGQTRCSTIVEQLTAIGGNLEEVIAQLPAHADESTWANELEAIQQRIKRLGAINLAAIEEFASESERKQYLDSQYDDVQQALQTLEEAIQKIDQETRVSFRETYNTINNYLSELFPQVFSGGEAYLELTDDDILTAGVRVIARPPGKKNSSIHLLSGGEKALTAIALVFSFFKLQPSPFCMLDEVDAPLDDANVSRYCNLVKQMSKHVQFIVITHNKITMEMSDHLTGVTMREPGVSRLVSVNVEEAAALAQ